MAVDGNTVVAATSQAVITFSASTGSPLPTVTSTAADTDYLIPTVANGLVYVASNRCIAAGDYQGAGSKEFTLTEVWNGGTWSILPSINPDSIFDVISSVRCITASVGNFCVAVGRAGSLILVEKYSS